MFSCLKLIKTNNRTSLATSTVDDLLEILVEGPPFKDFSADSAVELWWKDSCATRRPNQGPRKAYKLRCQQGYSSSDGSNASDSIPSSSTESESQGSSSISLDLWDQLFLMDD